MKIPICLIFPFVLLFPHARAENPDDFSPERKACILHLRSVRDSLQKDIDSKRLRINAILFTEGIAELTVADQPYTGFRSRASDTTIWTITSGPSIRCRRSTGAIIRPPSDAGTVSFPSPPLPGRSGRNGLAGTRIQKSRAPDVVCRFSGARAADKHGIHPGAGEHEPGRGKKPRTSKTRAGTGRPVVGCWIKNRSQRPRSGLRNGVATCSRSRRRTIRCSHGYGSDRSIRSAARWSAKNCRSTKGYTI